MCLYWFLGLSGITSVADKPIAKKDGKGQFWQRYSCAIPIGSYQVSLKYLRTLNM